MNAGLVIFVLFFGISVLEALRTRNLASSVFWIVLGLLFIRMGHENRGAGKPHPR